MTLTFSQFLETLGGVLDTALAEAVVAMPVRSGDLAVAIALEKDVLRSLVDGGGRPNVHGFRRYRATLPPDERAQPLPKQIMDLLHTAYDEYKDVRLLEAEEIIQRAWKDDPTLREGVLQAWRAMHPPGTYYQRHKPKLGVFVDVLDGALLIDRNSVEESLKALEVGLDDLRKAIALTVLHPPDRFG